VTADALPSAAPGTAPYGLSDAGRPVALPILNDKGECVFTPLLIAGQAGAGKSSARGAGGGAGGPDCSSFFSPQAPRSSAQQAAGTAAIRSRRTSECTLSA